MAKHETFLESIWKHGFRSKYVQKFLQGSEVSNWIKGTTGSGLTNAQVEQNEWTEQMDNTKYQRQTDDMKAAGLNPALMYGQSVNASTPSGADAGSPDAGLMDSVLNMIFAKQRLSNLKAEADVLRSQADKNDAETGLLGSQTDLNVNKIQEVITTIQKMKSEISLNESQKELIDKNISWIDKEKQVYLDLASAETDERRKNIDLVSQKINNLKAEEKVEFQKLVNMRQEICESLSRITLNEQNAVTSSHQASYIMDLQDEIQSKIAVYQASEKQILEQTKLTTKELNWYWVNNGLFPALKTAGTAAAAAYGAGAFSAAPAPIGF